MKEKAIQFSIVVFIYFSLNLFLFLFIKNKILRFLEKSRYIGISFIIGSFIVPTIQGLWVLTLPYDKGYIIGLIFHTLFAVIFILLMFYPIYKLKKENPSISQDNILKSIGINSVLVCILYIIALPLFWILFGLFSVLYLALGFK